MGYGKSTDAPAKQHGALTALQSTNTPVEWKSGGTASSRLVPILAGSLFYVTEAFSFLLVHDTTVFAGA